VNQRYDLFLHDHSSGDIWLLGTKYEWGSAKARLASWLTQSGFEAGPDALPEHRPEMRDTFIRAIQELVALKPGKRRTVRHDSELYSIRHHNPKRVARVKAKEEEQDLFNEALFGRYWDELP
jgi:hypothetical protein